MQGFMIIGTEKLIVDGKLNFYIAPCYKQVR